VESISTPPTQVGSLSTLSSLNRPRISRLSFFTICFFPCGGEAQPSQTSRSSPHLGSSRATTCRLGGKPPRVTNAPKLLDNQITSAQAMEWLSLDSLLLSTSSQGHSTFPLNPNPNMCMCKLKSHKEMLGGGLLASKRLLGV
jgi:hypothetical protein